MAVTVSFINMKGGVGKTTVASQLAHAADTQNLKVLAVDLDPQSNLSQSIMGVIRYADHLRENKPTVAQIFDEYIPAGGFHGSPRLLNLDELIAQKAGYWQDSTLDLIPSRLELSRTLRNPTGKERRLAKALARIADRYDLIIVDCAPTESILTDAAYFASRYVIVPVRLEFMATIGLPLLARSIEEFTLENDDHEIEIAGLVLNHGDYSPGPEERQSREEIKTTAKGHKWHVFRNEIPHSKTYPKAARYGTPIARTGHARWDRIEGFEKLKDEIFDKLGIGAESDEPE